MSSGSLTPALFPCDISISPQTPSSCPLTLVLTLALPHLIQQLFGQSLGPEPRYFPWVLSSLFCPIQALTPLLGQHYLSHRNEFHRAELRSVFIACVPRAGWAAGPFPPQCPGSGVTPPCLLCPQHSSALPTATIQSARAPARAPVPPSPASWAAPAAASRAASAMTTSCSLRASVSPSRTVAAPMTADTCR